MEQKAYWSQSKERGSNEGTSRVQYHHIVHCNEPLGYSVVFVRGNCGHNIFALTFRQFLPIIKNSFNRTLLFFHFLEQNIGLEAQIIRRFE